LGRPADTDKTARVRARPVAGLTRGTDERLPLRHASAVAVAHDRNVHAGAHDRLRSTPGAAAEARRTAVERRRRLVRPALHLAGSRDGVRVDRVGTDLA